MADVSKIQLPDGNTYDVKDTTKQPLLVSGTNIKTVNNQSLLGSGNITIEGGGEHIEVTQAEYDALPQTDKDDPDKVYFIADGTPNSPLVNDSVPIGAIQPYGGPTAPFGWLICDGSAVRRDTYSELYNVIGTTYGAGDGSSTFNLPDLRGKVLIGESTTHAIGSSGGEETHTLTVDEIPAHQHSVTLANQGTMYSAISFTYGTNNGGRVAGDFVSSTGGGQAHNNMQPYLVGNYIIKAKEQTQISSNLTPISEIFDAFYPVGSYYETSDISFDPNASWGGTWILEEGGLVHIGAGTNYTIGDTGGEATHKLTQQETPKYNIGFIPAPVPGNHTQWNNGGVLGSGGGTPQSQGKTGHSGSGTGGSVTTPQYGWMINTNGGDGSHNNMQPYKVVNRWHRTA